MVMALGVVEHHHQGHIIGHLRWVSVAVRSACCQVCRQVCTCVSKGVAKFLYHFSDVLGLRQEGILYTWDLFMVEF